MNFDIENFEIKRSGTLPPDTPETPIMTSPSEIVETSVITLSGTQEVRRQRSACFICGSREGVKGSTTLASADVDFSSSFRRLFNFDNSQLFDGYKFCVECQEDLRTIGIIQRELDELQSKLQAARQKIYEHMIRNFKRNTSQLNLGAGPTNDREGDQMIQAQKRILKRASLMNSRSRKTPRLIEKPSGSFNEKIEGTKPGHPESVSIKAEPRSDLCVTDSDDDEFVKSACYTDRLHDIDNIDLRQPAVRLARMVILESLIKKAPAKWKPCTFSLINGNARKKSRSGIKSVMPMNRYVPSSSEIFDEPCSNPNAFTAYGLRKRNKPERYSEYFSRSDEELDIFGSTGSLSEASFGEDDDFIIGLDNELYDEYDSDSQERKRKLTLPLPKSKANQTIICNAVRPATMACTASEPSQTIRVEVGDIKEIDVDPNLHRCPISNCSKDYVSAGGLRKHLRAAHSMSSMKPAYKIITETDGSGNVQYTKLFPCEICGKEFKDSSALKYHFERHKPNSERKHICQECGKGFAKFSLLKRHKVKHLPKGVPGAGDGAPMRDLCQLCGKPTSNLTQHMRTHTGEKLHKCKFCEKAFNTSNSAKSHMRIHTGEKPFECKICESKFRSNQSYLRHQKVHDPIKAYICDFCGKSFRFKPNLKEHLHVHTRELPFRCNLCGRRYAERELLRKHMHDDHTAEQIERKRRAQRTREIQRQDKVGYAGGNEELAEIRAASAPSEESAQPANQSLIIPFQHSSVIPTRYY